MARLALFLLGVSTVLAYGAPTPEELEFFEQKIRPLLAENCYACHSAETMAAADLRLDSGPAMLAGGSRGPAIAPGDPAASLLIQAVGYTDPDLQMPPAGRLSDDQIADLMRWIELGAPDPRQQEAAPVTKVGGIDFAQGRGFWSFRPVVKPKPPAFEPAAETPVDAFIRSKLKDADLAWAEPADRRSLLRRVTFDLIGLPPTPEDVAAFVADASPDAYAKVVERLLASPHYGERWGRHWLDLVRYAETNGHEFDNDKLDSWRYRDYVINAFNQDLPYDVFVTEQIAGDLLPQSEQRLSSDGARYETPIAPGMLWLWEVLNSPTDSVKARADQVDNQIDVLSKAFFGLTVACARCHDHKFDPIPTADYYSVGGVLHSTQLRERSINSPEQDAKIHTALAALQDLDSQLRSAATESLRARAGELRDSLAIAAELFNSPDNHSPAVEAALMIHCLPGSAGGAACERKRQIEGLAGLLEYAATEPSHPYYPLASLAQPSADRFDERLQGIREEMRDWAAKAEPTHPLWQERADRVFDDFEQGYERWFVEGAAFGESPARHTPWSQGLHGGLAAGLANSYAATDEAEGILTSPKFRLDAKYVHVRLAGSKPQGPANTADLRVTVWANDHPSKNITNDGDEGLHWKSVKLTTDEGRIGYLQITDRSRSGHIVVDKIVLSNSAEPPPIAGPPNASVLRLLEDGSIESLEDLISAYGNLATDLWRSDSADPSSRILLEELDGSASSVSAAEAASLRTLSRSSVPSSSFAMSSMDADPQDIRIHLRGNHKNLGDVVPRQFLQVIAGEDQQPFRSGSGRLELAQWAKSPKNPLTARVLVNRVWKHHFGRGIVATPDNFGQTGDRPTHPDLLDWLAAEFIESGWSVKVLQRRIVLSSTYQMDSTASEQAKQVDPLNSLLAHMPVRRLEAEAIRDSILAVAGSLKPELGGPPIPPHISEHQDGRGKPESGPLDGSGRRSVYVGVRRNFLPPLFLAFDYPSPMSTIGRRGVSAVPSQALILLNNEFVNQEAAKWAERTLRALETPEDRIADMFERAFGRPPESGEREEILAFLQTQKLQYGQDPVAETQVWTDLAHVLINSTEFIFVR
ncbi:MAG: PSD1 and planctomycete cytochrome C domain-containing protein [Acidobacteria bacterium]|nr:PSD1 and planctomycete cytochrome C domain-containing protein [Acidobacteriota bacterium]MDA1234528.1 PSD1 and planctomycete cytochrome C domain-containing protein [Acidobacteriota bacterium]